MHKALLSLILVALLLSGCAPATAVVNTPALPAYMPAPTAAPAATPTLTEQQELTQYAPHPNDDRLLRGTLIIKGYEIFLANQDPAAPRITITGTLPSTCYVARVSVHPADADGRIQVEVYSLVEPDAVPNYPKPFKATVSLADSPAGKYSVWVNGESAGEITLQ